MGANANPATATAFFNQQIGMTSRPFCFVLLLYSMHLLYHRLVLLFVRTFLCHHYLKR